MLDAGDFAYGGVIAFEVLLAAGEDDDAFAGAAVGTPEEVALMSADGVGEAVFRAEEVDGAGLSVVLRKDAGLGADIEREGVEDAGGGGGHFGPAELVGEELRERSEAESFNARRLEVGGLGISN